MPLSATQIRDLACPAYYHSKRIAKLEERPTEAMLIGRMAHEMIERYIKECISREVGSLAHDLGFIQPYGDNHIVYWKAYQLTKDFAATHQIPLQPAPEVEVEFALDSDMEPVFTPTGEPDYENCWLRGRFDLLQIAGNRAIVTDFKTGFRILSPDEVENDLQMQLYGMAALALAANADEVEVNMEFLRYGAKRYATYRRGDMAYIGELVDAAAREIEAHRDSGEWPERPGDLCAGCSFPCELRQEAVDLPLTAPQSVAEAEKLASYHFLLQNRLERVTGLLRRYVDTNGFVVAAGRTWGYNESDSTSYPLADILKHTGCEIDALETWAEANEIPLERLTISGLSSYLKTAKREKLAAELPADRAITTRWGAKKI